MNCSTVCKTAYSGMSFSFGNTFGPSLIRKAMKHGKSNLSLVDSIL